MTLEGIGLHSGAPAKLILRPAETDAGITFTRVDLQHSNRIRAHFSQVSDTTLCTRLSNEAGTSVSTVEHLMAALAGLGVTNVSVEIDGPEVPIMDGSSKLFVAAIRSAGIVAQATERHVLRILKPVEVVTEAGAARLEPAEEFEIDFEIDFPDTPIGWQARRMNVANGAFCDFLADSRTFVKAQDVDALRARGLALGGSLNNAIVVDFKGIQNPGGFRHEDECVRHKMLDAVGDLALAGAPILGRYIGYKAGHGLTNKLLHKLFDTPGAWAFERCSDVSAMGLPGVVQHHETVSAINQ